MVISTGAREMECGEADIYGLRMDIILLLIY